LGKNLFLATVEALKNRYFWRFGSIYAVQLPRSGTAAAARQPCRVAAGPAAKRQSPELFWVKIYF
jgi:hypothetical protein